VAHGFQATPTWHQGAIVAREAGTGGTLTSSVPSARWAFSVAPTLGWGPPPPAPQRATAGWLAALPVFEPHWQVVMARGSATGWLEWGGEKFDFADAPCYAEKNWGAGFPRRWWWVQCDAFDGDERAALTAVGSTRGLGGVPGVEEEVGMVGLHWGGRFYELVPWRGSIAWEVAPWGSWRVVARGDGVEAEIEATCDGPGTPLRAPTPDRGLAVLCRDSFGGTVTVKLWATEGAGGGRGELLATLTSSRVAVETGGGPWPGGAWRATAAMRQPFRALAGAPVDAGRVAAALPARWRPKGL
jgi:tocopherol cyclase